MWYKTSFFTFLSMSLINHIASAMPINANNNVIKLPLIKRKTSSSLMKKRSSNRYRLYDQQQTEYLVKVNIGTPSQEFLVSIDTGR